jgi:hypothetical protein
MRPYHRSFVKGEPPVEMPIVEVSYVVIDNRLMLDPPPFADIDHFATWEAHGVRFSTRYAFDMKLDGDALRNSRRLIIEVSPARVTQHQLALGDEPSPYRLVFDADDYVRFVLLRAVLGCPLEKNVPAWHNEVRRRR